MTARSRLPPTDRSGTPCARLQPPARIAPQLAIAVARPPANGAWLFDIKLDGYRMMTRIAGGRVQLFTKGGHDWSAKLPRLTDALAVLAEHDAWLDGEIVVLNPVGLPDFGALQRAFDARSTADVVMFAFDLLWLDGVDLRARPLRERREALQELLRAVESPLLRLVEAFSCDPEDLLASAARLQLEGIMGKRADAPYRSGRNADWIKLKLGHRQEFVIGGFTRSRGATTGVRSLLLGVYALDGALRYAGSVPPHLAPRRAAAFYARALPLAQATPSFRPPPALERALDYYWVRPELACEVAFLEWTHAGKIRQPRFLALREDKPASEIVREVPVVLDAEGSLASGAAAPSTHTPVVGGVRITHPSRVLDAQSGQTKLALARYYDAIAPWALPHLARRPLSVLRAPDDVNGEQFFQKHAEHLRIQGIETLPAALYPGHAPLIAASSATGLVGLAQMGGLELHTWNASAPALAHPDRMIFDLDPDPALPWRTMIEAALLLKVVLDELGLASFVKTSGGKGLHIVVPLDATQSWDEIKGFSKSIAQHMQHVIPSRFSAVSGPRNRVGKIFVDYLRNTRGATSVAAFSVRALPGMGVSMPISWDEVTSVQSAAQWDMQAALTPGITTHASNSRSPTPCYARSCRGFPASALKGRRALHFVGVITTSTKITSSTVGTSKPWS